MRPCCFPEDQSCHDLPNFRDYAWCENNGGVLGPRGSCCANPTGGDCTSPEDACWQCGWEVENPSDVRPCCFRADAGLYGQSQYYESFAIEQCEGCGGSEVASFAECLLIPGELFTPCCTPQSDCYNLPPGETWKCRDRYGGTLGPLGACCQQPDPQFPDCDVNRCWTCESNPLGGVFNCCFGTELSGEYQWFGDENRISYHNCVTCPGGGLGVDEADCEAPIPEPECIDAPRPDRPNPTIIDDNQTVLKWTLDNIGTVVFGMNKMEVTQQTEHVLQGYQYPVSVNLIRPQQAELPVESCGHAGGRKTMLDDGYVYVETCSMPDWTSGDSFRRSYGLMRTFLPDEDTESARHNRALGMEDGYQYAVACIRLPWWTEALYRSRTQRCGSESG